MMALTGAAELHFRGGYKESCSWGELFRQISKSVWPVRIAKSCINTEGGILWICYQAATANGDLAVIKRCAKQHIKLYFVICTGDKYSNCECEHGL